MRVLYSQYMTERLCSARPLPMHVPGIYKSLHLMEPPTNSDETTTESSKSTITFLPQYTVGALGNTSGGSALPLRPQQLTTHTPYRRYFRTMSECLACTPKGAYLHARDVLDQQKVYFWSERPLTSGDSVYPMYAVTGSGATYFFADIDVSLCPAKYDMEAEATHRMQTVLACLPSSARTTVLVCRRTHKIGYHIHSDVVFDSIGSHVDFVQNHHLRDIVDMAVYAPNRCFRLPHAPKGEPAHAPSYIPIDNPPYSTIGRWCHPSAVPCYMPLVSVRRYPPGLVLFRCACTALALEHARRVYSFMCVGSPHVETETFAIRPLVGAVLLECDHNWCPQLQRSHSSTRTRIMVTARRIGVVCRSNDDCKNISCAWPHDLFLTRDYFASLIL